jgi:hypothetical protein
MTDAELYGRVQRLRAGVCQSGEPDTHIVTAFPIDEHGHYVVSSLDKREAQRTWKPLVRSKDAATAITAVETFVKNYEMGYVRSTSSSN